MPSYKDDLLNDLETRPGYAAKYLTAAALDSDEAFLVAFRDVATARTGMTGLATATGVNRVNLYRMLSKKGNPGIRNIRAILRALNLEIRIIDKRVAESSSQPQPATPTTVPQRIDPSSSLPPGFTGVVAGVGSSGTMQNYSGQLTNQTGVPARGAPVMAVESSTVALYLLPQMAQKPLSHFAINP